MSYAASAIAGVMILGGFMGAAFFALHLLDRAEEWNDTRRERALSYRQRSRSVTRWED